MLLRYLSAFSKCGTLWTLMEKLSSPSVSFALEGSSVAVVGSSAAPSMLILILKLFLTQVL